MNVSLVSNLLDVPIFNKFGLAVARSRFSVHLEFLNHLYFTDKILKNVTNNSYNLISFIDTCKLPDRFGDIFLYPFKVGKDSYRLYTIFASTNETVMKLLPTVITEPCPDINFGDYSYYDYCEVYRIYPKEFTSIDLIIFGAIISENFKKLASRIV